MSAAQFLALDRTESKRVEGRYRDAYRVANTLAAIGSSIKIVSLVVALLFGGFFATWGSGGGDPMRVLLPFIFFGTLFGGSVFLFGTLTSAVGQILKATLDSAVNTSPFLDINEKAAVMSFRAHAESSESSAFAESSALPASEDRRHIPCPQCNRETGELIEARAGKASLACNSCGHKWTVNYSRK